MQRSSNCARNRTTESHRRTKKNCQTRHEGLVLLVGTAILTFFLAAAFATTRSATVSAFGFEQSHCARLFASRQLPLARPKAHSSYLHHLPSASFHIEEAFHHRSSPRQSAAIRSALQNHRPTIASSKAPQLPTATTTALAMSAVSTDATDAETGDAANVKPQVSAATGSNPPAATNADDANIDSDMGSVCEVVEDDDIETSSLNEADMSTLPQGAKKGFYVVKQYKLSPKPFDMDQIQKLLGDTNAERLKLTPTNITLPLALMLVDSAEYHSVSRARKACRKANVLIHRGPLLVDEATGENTVFDTERCILGRVGDRVHPGDVLGKQVRMGCGKFPFMGQEAPFDLPVVYEDDYFAIVNKPAGVVSIANKKEGHGKMTVRAALPFALTPSRVGTFATLRRPQPVHRLDKPTSGLLVIAKTKPAMVSLCQQFQHRVVKKEYTAIVNGIPKELEETSISSQQAIEMGVHVETEAQHADVRWQVADTDQDGKHAVTIWRPTRSVACDRAHNKTLTLVELKPKTGRYHQLRRHMAWDCDAPIVGDYIYDIGMRAQLMRDEGLCLCSTRVTLEHPYFNSEKGRQIYEDMAQEDRHPGGGLWFSEHDDKVMVTAFIDLPDKFNELMSETRKRPRSRSNGNNSSC